MSYQAPYNHLDCLVSAGWVEYDAVKDLYPRIPPPYWYEEEVTAQIQQWEDWERYEWYDSSDAGSCDVCGADLQLNTYHKYTPHFQVERIVVCSGCGCGYQPVGDFGFNP